MGKKQSSASSFMNGLVGDPSTTDKSTNPVNPVLESFSKFKDPRIPSTDDSNRGKDLSKYTPYLGDSFVLTDASDKHRAVNQSTGDQFGNAVLRLLPNTALEFISMTANSVDLGDYANSDQEVGNWLSTWAQDQKAKIDEGTPIYRKDPGRAFDIGDTAWWMENGTNLVQSAAAFVGLGYLGGAGIGAISKGMKALPWLKSLGSASPKVTQGIQTVANAALLNQAEGIGIATSTFDTTFNKTLGEFQADPEMMKNNTPEQLENLAKEKAAEAASSALNFNKLNILLNLTSANLFIKTPALSREVLALPSIAKSFKRIAFEGLQEVGEEEINLISEKQAVDPAYNFEKAVKDIATREGAESALLGFIGGAAQTGLTMSGRLLPTQKIEGDRKSRNTIQRQRFLAQQEANVRWDGLTTEQKLQSKTDAFLTLQEQSKLIKSINEANESKDYSTAKKLTDQLLISQAGHAFNTGTTEQLINTYESFGKLSEEDATTKGIYKGESISDLNHYKNKAKKAVQTINQLEENWNNSSGYLNKTPIYDGDGERLWNGVYTNRAQSIDTVNRLEETSRVKEEYKKGLEDIINQMGIEDDSYQFNPTTGELSLIDISSKDYREGLSDSSAIELKDIAKSKNIPKAYAMKKDALIDALVESNEKSKIGIKSLLNTQQYTDYKSTLLSENIYNERLRNLATEYTDITSDSTQKEIKKYFKEAIAERKKIKNEDKENTTKKNNTESKNKDKSRFEQEQKRKDDAKKAKAKEAARVKVEKKTTPPVVKTKGNVNTLVFDEGRESGDYKSDKFEINVGQPALESFWRVSVAVKDSSSNTGYRINKSLSKDFDSKEDAIAWANKVISKDKTTPNIKSNSKFEFTAYNDENINTALTGLINNSGVHPDKRKSALKDVVTTMLNDEDGELSKEEVKEIKSQVESAYKYLEGIKRGTVTPSNAIEDQMKNDLTELSGLLEEDIPSDLSQKLVEETDAERMQRKTNLMISLITQGKQIDIDDFKALALWVDKTIGSDTFSKIFVTFQDLYNGVSGKKRSEYSYTDIFASDKDKKDFVDNTGKVSKNSLPFGVYDIEHNRLDDIHLATIHRFTQLNSLDPDGKHIDFGNLEDGVHKVIFGHNKIAYLARNYMKTIEDDGKGNIIVRKEDADDNINKISEELLDYSKLKVGSEVTLISLPEVTYTNDEGEEITVYADGKVVYPDGRVEQKEAQEIAPIGIMYNNQLLTSAFLHTAEWINEENVAGDVKLDREALIRLRRNVLNAGEQGVKTKIKAVSPGWLMKSVDGETDTVINNFPDLKKFAIKKNGGLYIDNEKTTSVASDLSEEGQISAIIPINDNSEIALTLNKTKINNSYANSIKEAVRIHFEDDTNNPVVKQLEDRFGINILSMDGLKEYIEKFIFTHNGFKGDTNSFENFIDDQNSDIYLIRLTNDGVEFGRGAGIGFNVVDKNSSAVELETLAAFLQNLYVNFDIAKLDTNDFSLPIIEGNTVKGETETYSNFISRHTRTKYFSTRTENGKPIYTIQRTFEFEASDVFVGDKEIENLKKEVIGEPKVDTKTPKAITRTFTSPTGKKITLSSNDSVPSDLSPKLIEETDFDKVLSNIPSDIYIKDMGFVLQNTIIDYITADVLGQLVIEKETVTSSDMFEKYTEYFKEVRDFYANEANNTAMAELAQQVIDNSADIIKIVGRNISKMNTTDISLVELNDTSGTNDLESDTEKQRFESEAIFKENPVSSLTNDIKKELSAISDVEVDADGKAAKDENGNIINRTVIFGLDAIVPFDTIINDLYATLASTNDRYVAPEFEQMIDELKKMAEYKPYMENVIFNLENSSDEIKAKFVTAMSKHYTHHQYVLKTYDREKKAYSLRNLDSDGYSNTSKVIQDWSNRLKRSKYVVNDSNIVENLKLVNKEQINTEYQAIITKYKEGKPIVVDLRNWLDSVGIKVPDVVLSQIKAKGYYVDGVKIDFNYMLTKPTGALYLINKNLTNSSSITTRNPYQDKAIKGLANQVAKSLNNVYSNSFSDVRGETYFGYSPNKYFIERFQSLMNDLDLLKRLKGTSFSGTSTWLDDFMDKDENGNDRINTSGVYYRNFKYFTTDGMKDQKTNEGKKLEDMSPADHEFYKLGLFFNRGNMLKKGRRVMSMLYPTISDKSLMLGVRQVGYHLKTMRDGNIWKQDPIWNKLYNVLIQSEINRIHEFQIDKSKYDIEGFNEGAELFYMIPELNELESIWENGQLKKIVKGSAEHNDIMEALKFHVQSLVDQKKDTWREYGFVETTEGKNPKEIVKIADADYTYSTKNNTLDSIANNFVTNYLLFNGNVTQMFSGDPALFFKKGETGTKLGDVQSTFINMGVRLAAHIAPGLDIPAKKGENFTTVFLKDRKGDTSVNKEYLKTILSEEDYKEYAKIAGTDAQEFTTLNEHLNIMIAQGRMSKKDAKTLLEREEKGLPLDIRKLTNGEDTLNPMKLVYMNKVWENGMEKIVYVKSSSFPLIKQLTRGLEIDKLRKAMNVQKVDRVAFSTAVKLGNNTSPLNVFDKDGSIKNNFNLTPHIQSLPRLGHRRQLEVPFKEKKYSINDGTQQSKLLFTNLLDLGNFKLNGVEGNLTGSELRDRFNDTYGKLFKLKYKSLMEELMIKVKSGGVTTNKLDIEKVQKLLLKEGLKRDFPINDIQALSLVDRNGTKEFIVPLWATASSSKFEAMLSSIVDNRIRKRIVNGKSYVLGTEEGFQVKNIKVVDDITLEQSFEFLTREVRDNIVFDEQWLIESGGKLRPMGTDGIKYDEVMLPMKFYNNDGELINLKQFVNKDGFLDTSKIDSQLLEQFGFRIPTQGHNSMSYMKVVGFLPYESGDLIIVPRDFTIRMGSDFDVDKLYAISYNTNYNPDNGDIYRIREQSENYSEEKDLQDKLLDIHFSVLGNKDARVQRQVHAPLGFGNLKNLANKIDEAYKDSPYMWSGMSEDYQRNRYLSARGAKIGVGAFSLDNTFNSLLQGNEDIMIMTTEEEEINGKTYYTKVPYIVNLGGRTSNELSSTTVNTKGKKRFKSDVISAFQSAAVDNEKVQLLNRLNINKHTFSAVKLLNQLGFEEDVTTNFINQPIIRDYVHYMSLAKDSSSDWSVDRMNQELNEKYPTKLIAEDLEHLSDVPLEMMKYMIYSDVKLDNFNDLQQALLQKFKEVSSFGDQLGSVQSTINSDSAGVGKNLFYSLIKEDQILDLVNNGTVYNAHKLIGEYWDTDKEKDWQVLPQVERDAIIKAKIDEGYVQTRGQLYIKPTTINGYASVYGTIVNAKLWNKFFGFNSPILLNAVEEIANFTGGNSGIISVRAEAYSKAWNFMKSYLLTRTDMLTEGTLIDERNRLLYDTKNNQSLATIIDAIKDTGLLNNNPFINRLETEGFKQVLPSRLTYNSSLAEGQDERYIYAGFIDLMSKNTVLGTFNGIEYTTRTLAQDLVTHQYITGGIQGANQFIKYIPIQYLNELGYYDLISGINLGARETFGYRDSDTFASTEQYIQHYPKEVAVYEYEDFTFNENKSVLEVKPDSPNTYGKYISIPTDMTKSGFNLYKQDGASKYIQIDTLGVRDVRETDSTSPNAKTTVASNKSKYSEPKTEPIPKKDEVKDALKVEQKKQFETAKVIPPESKRGLDYDYGLREKSAPGIKKLGNALNNIINRSDNKFYSWYADQLLKNLGKLSTDIRLTIDITLKSEGRTDYDNKGRATNISINPLEATNKEDFERVLLHEITHAFVKEASQDKNNPVVKQLQSLHTQFEKQVRMRYTSEVVDRVANELKNDQRISVKIKDARIIRAALSFDEFLTESMSNKDVQNFLDGFTPTGEFKKAWYKFKSLVADLLESFGFTKGKVLDYTVSNIISLIDNPKPSDSLKGEMKNESRTIEEIEKQFNLRDKDGTLLEINNPQGIVDWINDNVENLKAIANGKKILVKDHGKENSDLSISRRAAQDEKVELPISKLLQIRANRMKMLDRLINRADANNEFAKAEEYKQQKQELFDSIETINKYTIIENIETVAKEDLAEVANMLDKDLSESDILYALKITDLWEHGIDTFFDEETLKSEKLRDTFKGIEGTAEYYSEVLYNKLVNSTNQFIKDNTGVDGNVDVEQIMASITDISYIESQVLNLSRNDNILLSAIYNSVKKANYAASDEAREIINEVDTLIERISPVLENMSERGSKYKMFRQQYNDGLYTGNLVGKFTPEFEEALTRLNKWLGNVTDTGTFKNHAKKRKDKLVTFDVSKLFPRVEDNSTTGEIDAYKQELKDLLGDAAYNIYMNRQERMIERYEEDREHNLDRILSKYNVDTEAELKKGTEAYTEFYTWILQNSPYEAAKQLLEEKASTLNKKFIPPLSTQKYLVEVPRKTNDKGVDLGFYDTNFSTIENNKDLLEFYNYITDTFDKLKIYLPQEVQERIQFNGLPEISKTFMELANDVKGGKESMSVVWDKMRESVRTEDMSDISYSDNKADRVLSIDIMKNNKQHYIDYINRKTIEWQQDNPKQALPPSLKRQWSREAKDQLAQKKSYDLGKVVKAYSMLVLGYKHKSRIEDQLKAAETVIKRSKEMELSAKKRPAIDSTNGRIKYKEEGDSFKHTKASLDYFMDTFYGHSRKLEGVTSKEVLTTKENKEKDEIVRLQEQNQSNFDTKVISKKEYEIVKKELEEQKDRLGGVAVWSKRADNVLKYIQLKVMGWNLFSGFSNLGFGWIANFIEAADGRVFNQKELLHAYKLTLHSIGKNLLFGHVKSDTATKIKSLMDRFDVLKDMSNELYQNSIPSQFTKGTKWLAPYNITQRTEYVNQAPLMIALMNRIKTENGKALWEQFDKNGNWIGEGELPTDLITNFRLKLDGIIEKTHGDYGSPLKVKEKVIGRGLSQFRTWMFEGFAQRFEPQKYDPNLGMIRKGRYLTLSPYFKKMGFFGGLADLGINIARKLAFQGTKFDELSDGEIFNEVDAANMRKVLSEMVMYMSLTTTALMLKMIGGNLDDKEKYMTNYLINHSSRLRTDILFYFNPIEFRKLLRDPIPATTLIKDSTEWVYAAGKLVIGKDIYESGVYSGESRLFRESMQLLPFGTQVYRNIAASKTQY